MSYSKRMKTKGEKLQLSWWDGPTPQWKKKIKGKTYYFRHPDTKAGYDLALQNFFELKNTLDGQRPNFDEWQSWKTYFENVQAYFDRFGTSGGEAKVASEVDRLLAWFDEQLAKPILPKVVDLETFKPSKRFVDEFKDNLVGTQCFDFFSDKWNDRLERLQDATPKKHPQTITHWLDEWKSRSDARSNLSKYGKASLKYKIKSFEDWVDGGQHVSKVDEVMLEQYHHHLDEKELSKDSKDGYFRVFKTFVFWCSSMPGCEMNLPKNIKAKTYGFREPKGVGRKREAKKKLLWTVSEFTKVTKKLPDRYKAYLYLMLNCGFRHIDLSELLKEDLRLSEGRIVIQRNKLNQQDTAPVVSYPLWPKTLELLKKEMSKKGDFVFANRDGGQVERAIKLWWKRNKDEYGGKRLDYIRKTGSTIINRYKKDLHHLYLGESLRSTADIHYNFADGEPSPDLDEAIAHLGAQFGLCDEPKTKVELTPEMIAVLKEAGIEGF